MLVLKEVTLWLLAEGAIGDWNGEDDNGEEQGQYCLQKAI
jgi:hypothetical protein